MNASEIPNLSTRDVFEKGGNLELYNALIEYGFDSDLFLSLPIGYDEKFFVTIKSCSKPESISAWISTTLPSYCNRNIVAESIVDLDLQLSQQYSDMSRKC